VPTFQGLPQRGCRTARRHNAPLRTTAHVGGFYKRPLAKNPASSHPLLAAPSFFSRPPFPSPRYLGPGHLRTTRGSGREGQKAKQYQTNMYIYKQPKGYRLNQYLTNPMRTTTMLKYTLLQLTDMGPPYNDPCIWVSEKHHIRPELLSNNRGLGPSQRHFG